MICSSVEIISLEILLQPTYSMKNNYCFSNDVGRNCSKHNDFTSTHETGKTTAKPISNARNKKNNSTI